MTVAFVQLKNGTVNESPVAFTSNVTAGSTLIIVVRNATLLTTVTGITDTRSNSYAQRVTHTRAAVDRISIWSADNTTAGANSVTVAFSASSGDEVISMYEVSGLDTAGSYDQSNGNDDITAGGTGIPDPGSVTTTVANEFLISAASAQDEPTAATNWTLNNTPNEVFPTADQYRIVSSINTYSGIFGGPTGVFYNAVMASFKAAAGGAINDDYSMDQAIFLEGVQHNVPY